ncbi:hypothetical protein [Lactiplantibacillus plantarum]|uniref:hypothetical protein n=1 Tax=Lactiplantibacillus plantarum TaxID=1590 RepID=UPI0030F204ED
MIDWVGIGELVAAAATMITAIGAIWHTNKQDKSSMQRYVIDTMRKQSEQASHERDRAQRQIEQTAKEYREFQDLHAETVRKLNEQIGLKEEENQQLRATNSMLKAENDAYHAKYGGIEV